ncbi:MAG TPA: YncE family protein [Stellaceae bacterium]|nr:YncE family protein [Stellaceae bacterium]
MAVSGILAAAMVMPPVGAAGRTAPAPLVLEAKIPLGDVAGRIDHLAIDTGRRRLFVAELGNDSLGVVDLQAGKRLRTISGLSEPQGVGYEAATDTVYVANGGDGSVRVLRAADLSPVGRIELGKDADNVRVDAARGRVLVGYGDGAIAVIDPRSRTKLADIRLKAHPESFQIDPTGKRVFANLPEAQQIAVADLPNGNAVGSLPTQGYRANYPMALDPEGHRLIVAFRSPARLLVIAIDDGTVVADLATCGDADDVFVDARRRRIYVSCGAGAVDVFEARDGGYRSIGHIGTAPGARTSLFVPEMDRLFVAVRAAGREPAAIWVFRPAP